MTTIRSAATLAVTVATLLVPALSRADSWVLDASHSTAAFKVRHMMVSWVRGEFGKLSGTVEYDAKAPASAKVDISIDAASIDTRDPKRDGHLKNPDFFDVAKFPTLTFKSKAVRNVTKAGFDLVGDLTMHGVTKEVVLKVEGPSAAITGPWGKTRMGASGTTVLNRQDFGVSWSKTMDKGGLVAGNEIHVELEVELIKK